MRKLLDAMLNKKDVWVPHWKNEWESVKIVAITRAGTVRIATGNRYDRFSTAKAEDVHLSDPRLTE